MCDNNYANNNNNNNNENRNLLNYRRDKFLTNLFGFNVNSVVRFGIGLPAY